jgi:hypothetical protein
MKFPKTNAYEERSPAPWLDPILPADDAASELQQKA